MKKYLLFSMLMALPAIFTRVYVEISFYIYIMKIRDKNSFTTEDSIEIETLNKLLTLSCNKDTVMLPLKTYDWIWGEASEDHSLILDNNKVSISELVKDEKRVRQHRDQLVAYFISKLPSFVLRKLNARDKEKVPNLVLVQQDFRRVLLNY